MTLKTKVFKNRDDLKAHLRTHIPTLYHSSGTSTVIPFEKLEEALRGKKVASDFCLGNLSIIPGNMKMSAEGELTVSGAVTWQEARAFCRSHGRDIMTSPTEELALILAGLATSATGERCFGYGTLRNQVVACTYLNSEGEECTLRAREKLSQHAFFKGRAEQEALVLYAGDYQTFQEFKNAPYPRFEQDTDLMIGTEGQLGVVVEATIKTVPSDNVATMFVSLPRWEVDYRPHLELLQLVQTMRGKIISCELIDDNSLSFLKAEERPTKSGDLVYLEIDTNALDEIYQQVFSRLESTTEDKIFEIPWKKCHELRMQVPRRIFEENNRMGVVKKGTDVQVSLRKMSSMLDFYRGWSKKGFGYNLFGHFGDCHLHFNFMPSIQDEARCQKVLDELYPEVLKWNGSPFAEHGIGILKQKYIEDFIGDNQLNIYRMLKQKMDPHNQFFPMGFMAMEKQS